VILRGIGRGRSGWPAGALVGLGGALEVMRALCWLYGISASLLSGLLTTD